MAELALDAERRHELVELLTDEDRLRAEYPKVAEYLEAAPMLPGTGDDQADAAFDLRFAHYMTGGASANGNPYWDIVAPSVYAHEGHRVVNAGRAKGSARLGFAQTILQSTYAYAIPSPETIEWCSQFCDGRPVIELGAGRGYWAAQLARAGLTVDAYDSEPPDKIANVSFASAPGLAGVWYPVGNLDDLAVRGGLRPGVVLFLCWPPGWGSAMASEALAAFERVGGDRLILVGEPKGGKTGDDAFFDALGKHWQLSSRDDRYVSWWNSTDVALGWTRR